MAVRLHVHLIIAMLLALAASACAGTKRAAVEERAAEADTSTLAPSAPLRMVIDGPPATPVAVRPPAEHPLARVDRDAGISARLSDGSTVWFFGDSGERYADDSFRYFEIGSAAWAAPGAPTITLDVPIDDRVAPFATPTGQFPECPAASPVPGMWPLAAVVDPTEVDRVIVWMANICLGAGGSMADRGISVGEWRYEPTDPPLDRPIEVTILNQALFTTPDYGEAAFVRDGLVYVYGCDAPAEPLRTLDDARCRAARVDPGEVETAAAYATWDGSGWRTGAQADDLEFGAVDGAQSWPPGPFSVAETPGRDGFVMLYSPWPAFTPVVELRAASEPEGPWSAPLRLELPGCEDHYQGTPTWCYAANLQPDLSRPGRLAFGYYDQQLTDDTPQLGSYMVTSIGFELEHSR